MAIFQFELTHDVRIGAEKPIDRRWLEPISSSDTTSCWRPSLNLVPV